MAFLRFTAAMFIFFWVLAVCACWWVVTGKTLDDNAAHVALMAWFGVD